MYFEKKCKKIGQGTERRQGADSALPQWLINKLEKVLICSKKNKEELILRGITIRVLTSNA